MHSVAYVGVPLERKAKRMCNQGVRTIVALLPEPLVEGGSEKPGGRVYVATHVHVVPAGRPDAMTSQVTG